MIGNGASTLFADDPLVFKKLIYEMRFDEVSAVYALFGHILRGRCAVPAAELGKLLSGQVPKRLEVRALIAAAAEKIAENRYGDF